MASKSEIVEDAQGGLYTVVYTGRSKSDTPISDGEPVVMYRAKNTEDRTLLVSSLKDFNDGRYKDVTYRYQILCVIEFFIIIMAVLAVFFAAPWLFELFKLAAGAISS